MKTSLIIATCAAASMLGVAVWLATPHAEPSHSRVSAPIPAVHAEPAQALMPEERTPAPRAALQTFDPERLVAEISSTTDQAVIDVLAKLLAAQTSEEKGQAADELARIGNFDAVANLLRVAALQENADDRAVILEGLNNLTEPEGFATLASSLSATRDPQFLDVAVAELARAGSREVLESLVEMYRERNDAPYQKNNILRAIAALRHPEHARILGKLAFHAPEPALAEAAAVAWREIGP